MAVEINIVPDNLEADVMGTVLTSNDSFFFTNHAMGLIELKLVLCTPEDEVTLLSGLISDEQLEDLNAVPPRNIDQTLASVACAPIFADTIPEGEVRNPKIIDEQGRDVTVVIKNVGSVVNFGSSGSS